MTFKDLVPTCLTIALTLIFSGCATTHQNLLQVREGMDKSEVLELAGDPTFVTRKNSQDLWTYRYYQNNLELRKSLLFQNGEVVRVGSLKSPKHMNQAERADTLEDFEAKLIEHENVVKSIR